jgi:WS/DGAT C-terminal domain
MPDDAPVTTAAPLPMAGCMPQSLMSDNVTVRRLAAVDAQTLWLSAKIPNDQFLVYGFAGVPADLGAALASVRDRAGACADLTVRVRDRNPLTYPVWVRRDVGDDQLVVHACNCSWTGCLTAVCGLPQLNPERATWRLHVFTPVAGVPGAAGAGTVAVVQMSHALADGIRSSALAAWLFGRVTPVPDVPAPPPLRTAALPWRAYLAARTHRELLSDELTEAVPRQADSRPVLRSNARPDGGGLVRTVVLDRAALPGSTVTVAVLTAVSEALSGHLRALGDDPTALGAEVPMAKAGARQANNHFANVGVGLHPELPAGERAQRIAEELHRRRRRAAHPALQAASRAFAALPAPLLRWGVAQFDPTLRSPTATGNTVVSSVNRGAADLRFGDAPVVVTAGCPGLSPMMGLTHGVHGLGRTVAVSVHAAKSAVGDIDAYVERLTAALAGSTRA